MRRLAMMLVLCCAVSSSQDAPPEEEARRFIEEHFGLAKQAEAGRDFPHAAQEYGTILARYPDLVPEIYQNLGLVDYLQRQYEEAVRVFQAGLTRKPEMLGSHLFLGSSLLYLEKPADAIPHLRYVHERQPTAESARYLGFAYAAMDQAETALLFFKAALAYAAEADQPNYLYLIGDSYVKISERISNSPFTQKPESAEEHLFTARVLDHQGWAKLAAKQYLAAAKKDPFYAGIFCPFARVLACQGFPGASRLAAARYRALTAHEGAEPAVCELRACPAERPMAGLPVDFEAELRALPEIRPDPPRLVPRLSREINAEVSRRIAVDPAGIWKLAVDQLARGRFAAAADALRSLPESQDWLREYLMAGALFWNGDADAAEQVLSRNRPAEAKRAPLEALQWEVDQQLSLTYFHRLLDQYPQAARAHYLKARTLAALGDREAANEYKAAIAAGPDQLEFHLGLADWYGSNGQFPEALAECRQELALNPYSRAAMMRMGRIYVVLKDADQAMPYLEKAVEAYPDMADLRADVGRAYELLGRKQNAVAEYRKALELDPSMKRVRFLLAQLYTVVGEKALARREFDLYREQLERERIEGPPPTASRSASLER